MFDQFVDSSDFKWKEWKTLLVEEVQIPQSANLNEILIDTVDTLVLK